MRERGLILGLAIVGSVIVTLAWLFGKEPAVVAATADIETPLRSGYAMVVFASTGLWTMTALLVGRSSEDRRLAGFAYLLAVIGGLLLAAGFVFYADWLG